MRPGMAERAKFEYQCRRNCLDVNSISGVSTHVRIDTQFNLINEVTLRSTLLKDNKSATSYNENILLENEKATN